MSLLRSFYRRFRFLFSSAEQNHELSEELENHLQLLIEDNLRSDDVLTSSTRR
jgi:hypothetical protein